MLNVCALQGRLVADPELRHTQSGIAVTSFRVACDTGYGENKKAHFFSVVAWRQTAEFVCRYFTKGQLILINGSLQTRQYDDKQGGKHTLTEVLAGSVEFCGNRGTGESTRADESFEKDYDDDLPF